MEWFYLWSCLKTYISIFFLLVVFKYVLCQTLPWKTRWLKSGQEILNVFLKNIPCCGWLRNQAVRQRKAKISYPNPLFHFIPFLLFLSILVFLLWEDIWECTNRIIFQWFTFVFGSLSKQEHVSPSCWVNFEVREKSSTINCWLINIVLVNKLKEH